MIERIIERCCGWRRGDFRARKGAGMVYAALVGMVAGALIATYW